MKRAHEYRLAVIISKCVVVAVVRWVGEHERKQRNNQHKRFVLMSNRDKEQLAHCGGREGGREKERGR